MQKARYFCIGEVNMRILIIDVNYDYKNAMYRLHYNSLASVMQIDFYGPGYVSEKKLAEGLEAFLQGNTYDAIILGCYFLYSSIRKSHVLRYNCYYVHRNVIPYYSVNHASKFCYKILNELIQLKHPIKIIDYYEDYISMPYSDYTFLCDLLEHGFYMLSWNKEIMQGYDIRTQKKYPILTNYALKIANAYPQKYIPIPYHAVQNNELFFSSLENRIYDWCVPGNLLKAYYPNRSKIQKYLLEQNCNILSKDPYQFLSVGTIKRNKINYYKFQSWQDKFISLIEGKNEFIASHPKMTAIAVCRENYFEMLRNTRYAYLDGSIGQVMVRKYYEACANGMVVFTENVAGLKAMGFYNGVHYLMTKKENLLETFNKIEQSPELLQIIANNGRELVAQKHTFLNRAENVRDSILRIQAGSYKGAYWDNGILCFYN